jgi:putative flippase GtrA
MPSFAKLIRYSGVSAVSTATGLTVLGVLVGVFGFPAVWSNVIATSVGTVPSFELNRRWVWARRGAPSIRREVVPFCVLSFISLAWSTLAVKYGASWADTHHLHRVARTLVVETANVAAFGSAWVVQFVLCDKVLFRSGRHHRGPGTDAGDGPGGMMATDPALAGR